MQDSLKIMSFSTLYDTEQVAQRNNDKNLNQSYLLNYQLLSQKIKFIVCFPSFLCYQVLTKVWFVGGKKYTGNSSSFDPWNNSKFSSRPKTQSIFIIFYPSYSYLTRVSLKKNIQELLIARFYDLKNSWMLS